MRTDSEEAIRRSIIHSLLGDLDEQESRTLENWLKTPEHQDFYKKISNREYVRCKMAGLELSDKEKARERLKILRVGSRDTDGGDGGVGQQGLFCCCVWGKASGFIGKMK